MKDYYFYHAKCGNSIEVHGTAECTEMTEPGKVMDAVLSKAAADTKTDKKDWVFRTFNFLRTI